MVIPPQLILVLQLLQIVSFVSSLLIGKNLHVNDVCVWCYCLCNCVCDMNHHGCKFDQQVSNISAGHWSWPIKPKTGSFWYLTDRCIFVMYLCIYDPWRQSRAGSSLAQSWANWSPWSGWLEVSSHAQVRFAHCIWKGFLLWYLNDLSKCVLYVIIM